MVGAVRIGGHGIPGAEGDPAAFARAHVAFGYGAAYCPPVEINDTARQIAIEKAFSDADVIIAEVGIWKNLISSDPAERRRNMAFAAEKLAIADAVGALCAVSYIGSLTPGSDYAPAAENFSREGFDAAVDAVRELIDTVKPRRAKFALEMMQYTLPDSVNSCFELIRAVDRPMFGAHFDPVNLIMTPRVYWSTGALIKECFARLGEWVVSCHAKDIRLQHKAALHFDEVMIGEGVLDYGAYLTEIARLPRDVPLMIEHLEGPQYATARDAIYRAADVMWVDIKNRPPR